MQEKSKEEQLKEIAYQRKYEEQEELAQEGISSAFEGNRLVTIGLGIPTRTYETFKEFCVAQMARIGMKEYCDRTGRDLDDLIQYLGNLEADTDDDWFDDTMEGFDGKEGW